MTCLALERQCLCRFRKMGKTRGRPVAFSWLPISLLRSSNGGWRSCGMRASVEGSEDLRQCAGDKRQRRGMKQPGATPQETSIAPRTGALKARHKEGSWLKHVRPVTYFAPSALVTLMARGPGPLAQAFASRAFGASRTRSLSFGIQLLMHCIVICERLDQPCDY